VNEVPCDGSPVWFTRLNHRPQFIRLNRRRPSRPLPPPTERQTPLCYRPRAEDLCAWPSCWHCSHAAAPTDACPVTARSLSELNTSATAACADRVNQSAPRIFSAPAGPPETSCILWPFQNHRARPRVRSHGRNGRHSPRPTAI